MEADHLNFSIRQQHWMSRVQIWEGHTMRKPPSINSMRCQEYETQRRRTHCGYLKRMYCKKPSSINSIWMSRVHIWKGQWHKENRKCSSGTRHQCKLHVGILELNLEIQCHETKQGIQTIIQRNWGCGIQMNEISRLGQLNATLSFISTLWHRLSSSLMPAPIPPPLLHLKWPAPNLLLYWQSHDQDAPAWAFRFSHQ